MKPRIAFIKTPDLRGFSESIIPAFEKSLSGRGFETKVFEPKPENIENIAQEIVEFKPLFTFDINLDGLIFAEKDNQKQLLCDVLGNIHVSWFIDDPMVHWMKLKPALPSNQLLFLNIDPEHGQWLASMGKNIAFLSPGIHPQNFPPPLTAKEFDVAFTGPVVDPVVIEDGWRERLDENLYIYATELGRLVYRNPDMPIRYAASYLASQFNPQFQEGLMQFQKENEDGFMALLVEAGAYAMHLRRWQILESIDGFQINVIGKVEGELKDNVVVYDDIISEKDTIQFLSKTKIALLSQPPFIPSGLGFTVFDSMGANALTMVEERFSAKTFFKPGEEVVTYHPMDSIEIEGILAYYLEDMPEERENIAVAGRERVFRDHTLYNRGELLASLLENVIKQAAPPEGTEQEGEQPTEELPTEG